MQANRVPDVIVLNGGSSSGKTSIARALQESLPGTWLAVGVDTFIEALPGRGESPCAGILFALDGTISLSSEYRSLEKYWYVGLAAMAASGAKLILDEVFLSGGAGQDRLSSVFHGSEMFWVGVHCSPDVAAMREAQRIDRVEGMAREQSLSVHRGVAYDFEVDTSNQSTEECTREILSRLDG